MRRRFILTFGLAILLGGLMLPVVWAQEGNSIVEQIGCDLTTTVNGTITVNHPCQVNDFVNLFIYLSKWGMSILAFLATMMLVYGGTQFITAGGRASKVDEGKRVITGTIIGTMITLTAYIIINTTFAAFTDTHLRSANPFGVISTVFDTTAVRNQTIQGQTIPNLDRTFTGSRPGRGGAGGGGTTPILKACRLASSNWNHDCTAGNLQVYCADPENGSKLVSGVQEKLNNAKGCTCGDIDGCYGVDTIACVRQFQIANQLPPTGVVDIKTQDLIDNASANCGVPDATVVADLPTPVLITTTTSNSGCCVVKKDGNDLYCVEDVSTSVCQALGAGSEQYNGKCGFVTGTAGRCGFCSNEAAPNTQTSSCFMLASPHWCTNIIASSTFHIGKCDGRCATCINSLQ